MAVGVGGTHLADIGVDRGNTAEPVPVPDLPQALGTDVAYSIPVQEAAWVMPAGAGFILGGEDALVAYDGATGQPRWRLPFAALPTRCEPTELRSTGTSPDAVVILGCRQPVDITERGDHHRVSVHVGLDALTGRPLWRTDRPWELTGPSVLPPDAAVVTIENDSGIGALDVRTGELRWRRAFDDVADCDWYWFTFALAGRLGYLESCTDVPTLHVFDTDTGQDRPIELPPIRDGTSRATATTTSSPPTATSSWSTPPPSTRC